ncbi:MAG: hypothetical protein HYY96_13330 [Candidatus Tectomicrobia bacterium]|nr:hypothetical protein [Candidatus Tectomicrobia bacterium]
MDNASPTTPGLPPPPRRARGKALLVLLGVFALGLGSGLVLDRAWVARRNAELLPGPPFFLRQADAMHTLMEQLHLSPEQRARVGSAIERGVERFRAMRQNVRPEFFTIMEETRAAIEAELTPEQRERFRRDTAPFMRHRTRWMERHHREMGMGPGGMGGMRQRMGMPPGSERESGPAAGPPSLPTPESRGAPVEEPSTRPDTPTRSK